MSTLKKILRFLPGLHKTLFFNFKYLPFRDAIRLPILVAPSVVLMATEGDVVIEGPIRFGMIQLGFGDVAIFDRRRSRSIWHVAGKVVFRGQASIGHGTKLSVNRGGVLTFGRNHTVTAESQIVCNLEISFGDEVLMSWDCLVMDTDFHKIRDAAAKVINADRPVVIGNHVWICARSTILKGTQIGRDCVVAADSCIAGRFPDANCVIGGSPGGVIKRGITWEA